MYECSVCREIPTTPMRAYSCCQHYNCTSCVDGMLAASSIQNQFPCPQCRELVIVPPGGLQVHCLVESANAQASNARPSGPPVVNTVSSVVNTVSPVVNTVSAGIPLTGIAESHSVDQLADPLESYNQLADDDERCDCKCPNSCKQWRTDCIPLCDKAFCGIGGTFCSSHRYLRLVLLPFWVLVLLEGIVPCMTIFHHKDEHRDIDTKKRDDARKAIIENQSPIFSSELRVVWAFSMIFVLGLSVCFNIYQIAIDLEERVLLVGICAANCLFIILWGVSVVMTIREHGSRGEHSIRRDENSLTFFVKEQFQQYFSEVTVYPQLWASSIIFPSSLIMAIPPFILCSLVLLAVFSLRIYTIVQLRHFTRVYYARLVFACVGNSIIIVILLSMSLATSFSPNSSHETNLPPQLVFLLLLLTTTALNLSMFYISHMYEVSLQAGSNMLQLEAGNSILTTQYGKTLTEYETFYKNMYPLSSPFYRVLLFLWLMPSMVLMVVLLIYRLLSPTHQALLIIYFVLQIMINHKTFLLHSATWFMLLFLLFYIIGILLLSMGLAVLIYSSVVMLSGLLIVICIGFCIWKCCCKCSSGEVDPVALAEVVAERQAYNEEEDRVKDEAERMARIIRNYPY